jgi:hypothetical protein
MSSINNSQTKRKEIYRYEAPWMVYAMNWSIRPDKRFRLALGSFVEEYNNKVNEIRKYILFETNSFFRFKLLHLMKIHLNLFHVQHSIIRIQQRKSCGYQMQ